MSLSHPLHLRLLRPRELTTGPGDQHFSPFAAGAAPSTWASPSVERAANHSWHSTRVVVSAVRHAFLIRTGSARPRNRPSRLPYLDAGRMSREMGRL